MSCSCVLLIVSVWASTNADNNKDKLRVSPFHYLSTKNAPPFLILIHWFIRSSLLDNHTKHSPSAPYINSSLIVNFVTYSMNLPFGMVLKIMYCYLEKTGVTIYILLHFIKVSLHLARVTSSFGKQRKSMDGNMRLQAKDNSSANSNLNELLKGKNLWFSAYWRTFYVLLHNLHVMLLRELIDSGIPG